ncbi:MAG TPA: DUF29 domain-containing protein [Cyanothece sp. UBA12306]|nr:DUF29 domain-containing protein [Cyanothece sp. UBA12306]
MLYETDIIKWVEQQVSLLKEQRYTEVDWVNILEEIEDLSKRERDRFLSSIRLIIQHLLKWEYQPEKLSKSWEITIKRERNHLKRYLRDTPSLKRYWEDLSKVYQDARADAANETGISDWKFPDRCPYSPQQIQSDWFPVE